MKFAPVSLSVLFASSALGQEDKKEHYLVGLLNYPNSYIPEVLQGVSSGNAIPVGDQMWSSAPNVPFTDVPGVGFSDMELYYDADGNVVKGEYFCLSDNGFGSSDNSADYPLNIQHLKIQKPFTYRHAETTFEKYTEVTNIGTALIHDPDQYIKWENGADIQVTYGVPDETWDEYVNLRVLTGRDFDPEGLAVISQECAVLGDEMMPAIFMVNPTTGVVLSPFVRTPDIDEKGAFNGKFLSTRSDKVHCSMEAVEADTCSSVESSVVDDSEYTKHDKSGGYEGFSLLADGTIAAFLEKKSGDTDLSGEPGVRVYHVVPGDCSSGSEPEFAKFFGFYKFEVGAGNIADVSTIPGSSRFVAVIERNGFPSGHMWPGAGNPANHLCVVDLLDVDEDMVFKNKKCILNYHNIDDPWDADGNGIFKYGHTQVTNEALVVVDDYCFIAGTDTNYPWTNQFAISESAEFFQEVSDARFMVVCFVEPVFSTDYTLLKELGTEISAEEAPVEETEDAKAPVSEPASEPVSEPEVEEVAGVPDTETGEAAPAPSVSRAGNVRNLREESTYSMSLAAGGLLLAAGGFFLAN
mmetsp:Transcript_8760/g.20088  ORF Transcript_8760/g.20088 Transcript_8760/m.20088 type:complete len:580 (+) Transcript_8760:182-1921(+)